mgnify:CR=1 FL=1
MGKTKGGKLLRKLKFFRILGLERVEQASQASRVCGVSNKTHEVPVGLGSGPRKMLSENMMFQNMLATEHQKLFFYYRYEF